MLFGEKRGRGFYGHVSLRNDVKKMSLFQDALYGDTEPEKSKRNVK